MDRANLALRRLQTQLLIDLQRIRHASEQRVEALLADAGLQRITPSQANALMVLVQAREPLNAARLARELAVSEVTVGRFVRALQDAGWVERLPDPTDSRKLLLRPTEQARGRLRDFIAVTNALLDRAFADFTPEEIEQLASCCGRMRDNLDPEP